jgi:hypothetical protein
LRARLLITLTGAIAAVAIASGCGSDSDGTSSPGTSGDSPSKAEFVEQGNAACQEEREGALDRVPVYEKAHSSEGLSEALLAGKALRAALLATIAAEIEAIRELGVPPGDEDYVEAILTSLDEDFDNARTRKTVKEIESAFGDSGRKLKSYGLVGCAKYTR